MTGPKTHMRNGKVRTETHAPISGVFGSLGKNSTSVSSLPSSLLS